MEFSLTRLFNLIKKDLIVNRRILLLSVLALFGVCALMVFFTSDGAPRGSNQVPPDAAEINYFVMLIICGCIITAIIFREFRTSAKRIQYLSIPASNFEKIFSKWLYTLPFYLILVSVIFAIGYQVFGSCLEYLVDVKFVPLKYLHYKYFGYTMLAYLILHSVVFFFSVIFNSYPIPKIMVTAFVCVIVAAVVFLLLARGIFHDHFKGFLRGSALMFSRELSPEFKVWGEEFFTNLPYLFAMIGVPFIWVITYFKMKEKEA